MELTEKQNLLFEWVKFHHRDQKRKYTNDPYWIHLLSVAEIVDKYDSNLIEIALCHDLFEDTVCTHDLLYDKLITLGYEQSEVTVIIDSVDDLTDRFTKDAYPDINRKQRKEFEAQRLSMIFGISMTVKYADLIDNTNSIVDRDPGFAKVYLQEKENILTVMRGGNQELRKLCKEVLKEAKEKLRATA